MHYLRTILKTQVTEMKISLKHEAHSEQQITHAKTVQLYPMMTSSRMG